MADNNVISQGLNEVKNSIAELQKTANMSKPVKANIASLLETIVGIQAAISTMGEDYLSSSGKLRLTANIVFMQNYVKDLAKLSKEIGAYSESGKFAASRSGVRTQTVNASNTKKLNLKYNPNILGNESTGLLKNESDIIVKIKERELKAINAINVATSQETSTLSQYHKVVEKVNKELLKFSDIKSRLRVINESNGINDKFYNVNRETGTIGLNVGNASSQIDETKRERESLDERKKQESKREELAYKSELRIKEKSFKINKDAEIKLLKIKQDSEDKWAIAKLNSETKLSIEERKLLDKIQARQEKDRKSQLDKATREAKQQSQAQERVLVQANQAELENVKTKEKLLAIVKRINTEMIKVNPENMGSLGSSIASKSGGMLNFNQDTQQIEATSEALNELSSSSVKAEKSVGFLAKTWNRITFVITAKFAYEIIGAIQKLASSVPKLWKEVEVSLSETFGILNQQGKAVRDGLTDGVIQLSKKYGIAAKEISDSLYEIISAQVKASDAINVLDTAIKLSLAGKGNIKDSVEALVEIMNAYDMEAKDVNKIADIAFQTSKYGQLTIAQYTSNMSKIVATASLMKIPIEEISAAIATMTLNGVHAEQAFTSLNQMFMIIANPTDKAEKMMKQLGVNIKIADVRTLGLAGALAKLQPLMAFENNEEAITEIFKSRTGFKAFASLMKNNEEYIDNYIHMIQSSGVSEKAFAERENTLEFQTNRLKTSFEALIIAIGKAFAPVQLKYITSLSSRIEDLTKNTWKIKSAFTSLIATLGTFLVLFGAQKITAMYIGLKSLFAMTQVELVKLKVAIAESTAGLSIIVAILVGIGARIYEWGKNNASLATDKMLGLNDAVQKLGTVEAKLKEVDSIMNQMTGVKSLITQWDELNKLQAKNPQQIKAMDKYFDGVKSTMKFLGLATDETGSKMEQMARYSTTISGEIIKLNAELSKLTLSKTALEAKSGIAGVQKEIIGTKAYKKYLNIKSGKKAYIDTKPYSNATSTLFSVAETVSMTAGKLRADMKPSDMKMYYDILIGQQKYLSQGDWDGFSGQTIGFRNSILEQINSLIGAIISIQQANLELPETSSYSSTYTGLTGDKSSINVNINDLRNKVLGNRVEGITVNEVKESALKLVEDFKEEMAEKERNNGVIKNKEKVTADLEEFTAAINDGTAEILASSLKRNLDETLVQLDARSGLGENVSGDLLELYVKMATEQSLLSPNTTKGKSDAASLSKSIIDKAKSLLNNEDYLSFMKDVGLLDSGLLMDYGYVNAAYNNASDPNIKSALKNVLDAMDDSINKVISDAAGTSQESKWLSAAKTSLKNRIDEANKPLSDSEMKAYIDAVKDMLKKHGIEMTAAEEKALTDINYDAKKQSTLFKLLGVKENKNPKDMIDDIGGQMVSGLQNLWTGYWDWEIRGIESQQKKKLELMDKEKAMMLANQNMSAEQRAIIEARYNEKKRIVEEKNARKIADMKKRQAKYDAGIELAKGLIGIWASHLKYPVIGVGLAGAASGALLALFASQMAIINQTKFAKGGFTGSGFGNVDETGQRPAGVVHANEMVFDAKSTMANLPELMSLYRHLNAGGNFMSFMASKMNTGGYVSQSSNGSGNRQYSNISGSGNSNIVIDLKGIRTIDDVDISKIVERGNQKRRYINV